MRGRVIFSTPINVAYHGRHKVDSENVVCVCKEANTRDNASTNMEPAKLGIIKLVRRRRDKVLHVSMWAK